MAVMDTNTEDNGERKRAPKKDWTFIIKDGVMPILKVFRKKHVRANLRKTYYNLVSKELIGNTESDYKTLGEKTKNARMNGILPIDCFKDEVRQTFDNGYKDEDEFENMKDYLKHAIDYLHDAPDDYVESLPTWYKQKHYLEKWLEKAAMYGSVKAYLSSDGNNRHVRVVLDRGNTSLGIMVENVKALRKIAKQESEKEMHIQYYGDMDPSGDDMDRDLKQRIKSVNARINIDEFRNAQFEKTNERTHEFTYISGTDYLQEMVNDDLCLKILDEELANCPREDDTKDKITGKKLIGRNTIRDQIRIRKSEIIASYYPKEFPHFVVLTDEEEKEQYPSGLPEGVKKIHFERIAVTEQQILEYNLIEMPKDQKTIDKLDRDSKKDRFVEKYGRLMAVEVDALDALHPDVLEELVQDSVDKYYDDKIYKENITDKYGTKEYKREIRLKTLQMIRDFEVELEDELAKDDE